MTTFSTLYIFPLQKWQHICRENDNQGQPWPEARVGHTAVSLHDPDSNPKEPELLILWGQDDKSPVSTLNDSWVLQFHLNGNFDWLQVYYDMMMMMRQT